MSEPLKKMAGRERWMDAFKTVTVPSMMARLITAGVE